jgi:hypothetical protein
MMERHETYIRFKRVLRASLRSSSVCTRLGSTLLNTAKLSEYVFAASDFSLRAEVGGEDSGDTGEDREVKLEGSEDESVTGVIGPLASTSDLVFLWPLNKFLLLSRFSSFFALPPMLAKLGSDVFLRGLTFVLFTESSRALSNNFSFDELNLSRDFVAERGLLFSERVPL